MTPADVGFARFFFRLAACHTVTYMVAGIAALHLMNYTAAFAQADSNMVPVTEPIVALGPALQVARGLLFAVVLYPFRRVFLEEAAGWLKLWGLFLGLAILGTAGAVPGSFEGLIFTRTPVLNQIAGLWEGVVQTLLLSVLLIAWHRRPGRGWIVMYVLWALTILMSLAGAMLPR